MYECGVDPLTPAAVRVSVKFYLVAILFILFDLEATFLYPWAVLFRLLGWFGFIEMAVFVGILLVGLVYAWKKGSPRMAVRHEKDGAPGYALTTLESLIAWGRKYPSTRSPSQQRVAASR